MLTPTRRPNADTLAISRALADAASQSATDDEGNVYDSIPALAATPPELFGIAFTGVDGQQASTGDSAVEFSIQSISKPFVFAMVCAALGGEEVARRIGVNSTGLPFNANAADTRGDGVTNPMMNAGAILTASLVLGDNAEAKWNHILTELGRFAGRTLTLNETVYRSETANNLANRALARSMADDGRLLFDPLEATDIYTRQCSVNVTVKDLSVMSATLATGGENPVTGERVLDRDSCQRVLAVLATAGLYERSGQWLYDTGMPAKSGVSGGLMAVSVSVAGVAAFSPRVDAGGSSVRGQAAIRRLSSDLHLGLFASEFVTPVESSSSVSMRPPTGR